MTGASSSDGAVPRPSVKPARAAGPTARRRLTSILPAGFIPGEEFPAVGRGSSEQRERRETDSELQIKSGEMIPCLVRRCRRRQRGASERGSGRHMAAECVSSPLAARLPGTHGETCQRRPALSAESPTVQVTIVLIMIIIFAERFPQRDERND